jgi:adenylate cyclase
VHWLHRHRFTILAAICTFVTVVVVAAHFLPGVPYLADIWRSDQSVQDLLRREGRKTPTRPDFAFIGIDQESLEFQPFTPEQIANNRALQLMAEKPFPWSREVWALVLDRLFNAGARLVMFDISFSSARDGDAAFRAALDRYRDKVVIGANVEFSKLGEQGAGPKIVPPSSSVIENQVLDPARWKSSLLPASQMVDDRVGYVVFFPDQLDGKIRSLRYTITERQLDFQLPFPGDPEFEALSARAAEKLGHANDVPRDLRAHMLRFSALDAYEPKKLWEILDDKMWHFNFHDGQDFKDKVIVIGMSAQIQHDYFDTPLSSETPGPILHLHALAAVLAHEFVFIAPLSVGFATIIGGGILSWIVVAFIRRPFLCFVTLLALAGSYLVAVRVVYDQLGYLVLVIPPVGTFLVSGLSGFAFEYLLERIEKVRTRRTLERYVSKNIVREILDNPGGYYSSMLGSRKPVTVLFSDLVGFTSLSERADPAALVSQLNRYLSAMVPQVFDNGGTLDKFIGDAIMAVWGNVTSHGAEQDAKAAVRAAHGMRRVMAKLNEEWRAEGISPLAFGVGINHGDAIVGNIGSYEPHERLDPTVIGDAVNLASRLEALTRTYSVDILIGTSAAELVGDEFHLRSVARVQVKGKTEPVDVFTLIGARTDEIDPELLKWLQTYEEAIVKFRKRDFKDAKILFSHFLEFYPEDALGKMYLAMALKYEKAPPDEAWNAVEVFKKK